MTEKDPDILPQLNLPVAPMKIRLHEGHRQVLDPIRRKYVALTPEEYVRQQFVAWLRGDRHFPASLIANEIGIELNGTRRRCDTLIFGRDMKPLVIVEYKAPSVPVTQNVFDQIVRYNITLRARYLIVSNGMNHYCCRLDYEHDTYHFIPQIPDYADLFIQYGEN